MYRIIKFVLILSVLSFSLLSPFQFANAAGTSYMKENGVSIVTIPSQVNGKIILTGDTTQSKIKILVMKDSYQEWFDVDLNKGKFNEEISLIEGKGTYDIAIMVNLEGRKYTYGPRVKVENTVDVNRFLVPTKDVDSNNKDIIDLAKRLTKFSKTDRDKAKNIYNWVTKNIKYDYDKRRRQLANDFDDPYGSLITFETRKGICYDYATLLAALGRAVGLQVKVIRGDFKSETRSELHAWNEIYLPEEDRWINADATFGYALNKNYFDNKDFNKDHIKTDEY